jgi:hypothetical protein
LEVADIGTDLFTGLNVWTGVCTWSATHKDRTEVTEDKAAVEIIIAEENLTIVNC